MNEEQKRERAHCNKCGPERWHDVIGSYADSGSDDETEWEETYQILRCGGCGAVCFRKSTWFSEWDDIEYSYASGPFGTPVRRIPGIKDEYFPPAVTRDLPRWEADLPREIRELMAETYTALHADSRRLAMMGARAIADMAIVMAVGDVGSFGEKLKAMVSKGALSADGREILDAALDAGNAAAHRGHRVSSQDADVVMDIIENLLHSLFSLPNRAGGLRSRIPPRARRQNTSPPTGEPQ